MDNFLKNLKKSLEEGKPSDETKIINAINDEVENVNTDRLNKFTKKQEQVRSNLISISSEERKRIDEDYKKSVQKMELEDKKNASLANIENLKTSLNKTREEVNKLQGKINDLEKKYEKLLIKIENAVNEHEKQFER